jgi:hypothetical protein
MVPALRTMILNIRIATSSYIYTTISIHLQKAIRSGRGAPVLLTLFVSAAAIGGRIKSGGRQTRKALESGGGVSKGQPNPTARGR